MASTISGNRQSKPAILVEPTRIVGHMLRSSVVNIEPERPISRLLGGYVVYFSVDLPFAVDRGNGWEQGSSLVLVRPYEQHRLLRCEGLRTILIEPESVCPLGMEDERWMAGTDANRAWIDRIAAGFGAWQKMATMPERTVDELVFGENLRPRQLDSRIASVVDAICACSSGRTSQVLTLARQAGLSTSRLSHLFREQLGIPVRSFRAWKRVRNSMVLAASETILINAALDAGYADEPHYSRSMRKYFGQHAHVMQRHWRSVMTFRAPGAHCA